MSTQWNDFRAIDLAMYGNGAGSINWIAYNLDKQRLLVGSMGLATVYMADPSDLADFIIQAVPGSWEEAIGNLKRWDNKFLQSSCSENNSWKWLVTGQHQDVDVVYAWLIDPMSTGASIEPEWTGPVVPIDEYSF